MPLSDMAVARHNARERAKERGHHLDRFQDEAHIRVWEAYCVYCGKRVVVRQHPGPNQSQTSGDALLLTCKGQR
jgi:hypothetical protein